jgi:hypothetical protein
MRVLAVWAVLFAAYAATLGVDALGRGDFAGDEPRYLLAAESIVSDRDIDLRDEFASGAAKAFHPEPLRPEGSIVLGRQLEPQGFGFALLIAPAYAVSAAPTASSSSSRRWRRSRSRSARCSRGGSCPSRGRAPARCSSGCRRRRWRMPPACIPT